MANRLFEIGGCRCCRLFCGAFNTALQRTAHQLPRTQTHRQRQRKHDASEENPEGQINHHAANLQVFQRHRCGQHQHQPLHAKRKKTSVLKLRIDCPNQH